MFIGHLHGKRHPRIEPLESSDGFSREVGSCVSTEEVRHREPGADRSDQNRRYGFRISRWLIRA